MKRKIIAFVSAFIISMSLFGSNTITAHANSGGGGSYRDLSGFETWSIDEKMNYWGYNALQIYFGACGVLTGSPSTLDIYLQSEYDSMLLDDCTYEEWITARMGVEQNESTGQYELVLDDELVDLMKKACDKYIKEECGWYEMKTTDYRSFPASDFPTQGAYQAFIGYCTQNVKGTDNTVFLRSISQPYYENDIKVVKITISKPYENIEYYAHPTKWSSNWRAYITQKWETMTPEVVGIMEDGSVSTPGASSGNTVDFYPEPAPIITDGARTVRVYKSFEELKNYSVGQRPYYATSKFFDYDMSGDNSCVLSETQLSNGSVYGDVYNYIMDNYDNPNGLSEDQLTIIVETYVNGTSGGGGGSGSGNNSSGSSGNGLFDFLGGLGSIGDAILSILGKLLEYIGKALDLISGTVTKVIDIIPKNITALLGALFPFFPEEWLIAIELGLVLAVIVGIVGIFKK